MFSFRATASKTPCTRPRSGKDSASGRLTGAQRAEGRIIQSGRAHPTVVGLFRYAPTQCGLPYDVRIQHEVEIPRGNELTPAVEEAGFSARMKPASDRAHPRLDELDGAV